MTLRWSWRNLRGSECFSGRRLFFPVGFLGLLVLGGCEFERQSNGETSGPGAAQGDPASEIEAMLLASAASWNGGDLDGFMDDYWPSEELTFSGGTGVTRGWENVRTRYLESYWAPGCGPRFPSVRGDRGGGIGRSARPRTGAVRAFPAG